MGLTTRATPKIPSKPVSKTTVEGILKNPYYMGVIRYNGVEYDGAHDPLTDMETFNKVQSVLESHISGERTREHPHFLKGSLYCRKCGSRMIVTYAKSHTGVVYPYFICAGRHRKSGDGKNCTQKAILIDEVEYQVEQLYDAVSISSAERQAAESYMQKLISIEQEKYKIEFANLKREKEKIERKQQKLLEAHLNDAIPLELMKRQQQSLAKQLAAVEYEIRARNASFEEIVSNLSLVMDLLEDCGRTYRNANDNIKRLMNQAIFERIWIEEDGRMTVSVKRHTQMSE